MHVSFQRRRAVEEARSLVKASTAYSMEAICPVKVSAAYRKLQMQETKKAGARVADRP
jgi:hypothetical protein